MPCDICIIIYMPLRSIQNEDPTTTKPSPKAHGKNKQTAFLIDSFWKYITQRAHVNQSVKPKHGHKRFTDPRACTSFPNGLHESDSRDPEFPVPSDAYNYTSHP